MLRGPAFNEQYLKKIKLNYVLHLFNYIILKAWTVFQNWKGQKEKKLQYDVTFTLLHVFIGLMLNFYCQENIPFHWQYSRQII